MAPVGQTRDDASEAVEPAIAIEQLVRDALELPSPPTVLARLLALLGDARRSRAQLVQLVELDAAFTADVLRTVSKAGFARRGAVKTVSRALAVLGEDALVRLVVLRSAAVLDRAEIPGYGLRDHGMWRRSVAVALSAEALARQVSGVTPGVAYTAGLLADIGKLALGAVLERQVGAVVAWQLTHPEQPFTDAERSVFGIDHAELGARMAAEWRLPRDLVAAIRHHHDPEAAGEHAPLASIVHVADVMATMLGSPVGLDDAFYALQPGWRRHVPVEPGDVSTLLAEVRHRLAEAADLLEPGERPS